jgi:hypothetical protein
MNRFDLQRSVPDLTPGCWIRKVSGGTDLFGRLWNRPAFKVHTGFFSPEKGAISIRSNTAQLLIKRHPVFNFFVNIFNLLKTISNTVK